MNLNYSGFHEVYYNSALQNLLSQVEPLGTVELMPGKIAVNLSFLSNLMLVVAKVDG